MREILFRCKRVGNYEWAYGFIVKMFGIYHIIDKDDENTAYEVIPETVGQDTGMKDENGKQIFEGDIVKTSDITYEGVIQIPGESFEIAMRKGCWVMVAGEDWDFLGTNHECIEVIGNIHDNFELLEETNS